MWQVLSSGERSSLSTRSPAPNVLASDGKSAWFFSHLTSSELQPLVSCIPDSWKVYQRSSSGAGAGSGLAWNLTRLLPRGSGRRNGGGAYSGSRLGETVVRSFGAKRLRRLTCDLDSYRGGYYSLNGLGPWCRSRIVSRKRSVTVFCRSWNDGWHVRMWYLGRENLEGRVRGRFDDPRRWRMDNALRSRVRNVLWTRKETVK